LPAADGVNVTLIAQVPFGAMDVGHADAAKGPTVETLVTFNVVN
jgi:hypothetical protein